MLRFALSAAQRRAAERLARDAGATTQMVMLAAFTALLHRLTAQDRVVVRIDDLQLIIYYVEEIPRRMSCSRQ